MKLKRKVIFIISSFLASDDDARKLEMKTEVREMGLIPIIASFVGHEDLNTDETAIECCTFQQWLRYSFAVFHSPQLTTVSTTA